MKKTVQDILAKADIQVNGSRPWDIQIHDDRFYSRVLHDRDLGLGESYMDGWWDCQQIDQMISRLLESKAENNLKITPKLLYLSLKHQLFNFQNKRHSKEVADKHYNLGNALYAAMLDKTMNYSCGYWKNAQTLDGAQRDKMDLICRKLKLKPGESLLDIGCGWGALAKFAAENYGVKVLGITISVPQKELAEEQCKDLPIQIQQIDYRDLPNEKFNKIVSVGMFEHVGYKNYRTFMEIAHQHLLDDGLFLLHTIGGNVSHFSGGTWMNKYIFPNGMLPSVAQIGTAIENLFIMEDWHNFGTDYEKTLLAWHHNFNAHWPELRKNYDDRFFRMWNYYLLSCAGSFSARKMQLWQIVLSKNGLKNGFQVRI